MKCYGFYEVSYDRIYLLYMHLISSDQIFQTIMFKKRESSLYSAVKLSSKSVIAKKLNVGNSLFVDFLKIMINDLNRGKGEIDNVIKSYSVFGL